MFCARGSISCNVRVVVAFCVVVETFPRVIFANSNFPENRFRISKTEEQLSELPDDSSDIFKHKMLDRYMDRPNATFKKGNDRVLNDMCYAEFLAYCYLDVSSDYEQNDNQPVVLNDEIIEENDTYMFPSVVPLMSSKQKIKCRKIRAVLRYHVPNRHKYPEKYAHHLLFMYYPFRAESELLENTCLEKLSKPGVLDIVNENKHRIEPFDDLVNEAFRNYRAELNTNLDAFAQQENEEVEDFLCQQNLDEEEFEDDTSSGLSTSISERPCVLSDGEINRQICSLNTKQREMFDTEFAWAKKCVKARTCSNAESVDSLYIFLTGQGGCGKSHLVKTIFHALSKTLLRKGSDPEKPRVLLLASTGVAAENINGTTIHSGLGIHGKIYALLSDKSRASLRNKLSEIAAAIIDEISMVSDKLLKDVHSPLCEIAGVSTQVPFAGKTIIAVGFLSVTSCNGKTYLLR